MKGKNVCNLPTSGDITDADGILITQGGKAVRMLMDKFRAYLGYASGADVLGVPVPTSADAGKVPAVNSQGNGYVLGSFLQAIESTEYPGCYYLISSNGATEWINPPMVAGEEYRTIERYKGKPVYTMQIERAVGMAAGETAIATLHSGTINASKIIGQECFKTNGSTTAGLSYYPGSIDEHIENVRVRCGISPSVTMAYKSGFDTTNDPWTYRITVKYIKN